MKHIITVQHTQSVHHTNNMVGSWTDWDLTDLGKVQADRIGKKLCDELANKAVVIYSSDLSTKSLFVYSTSIAFVWQWELKKFFQEKKPLEVRNTIFARYGFFYMQVCLCI